MAFERLTKRLLSVLLNHKAINTSQLCLYTLLTCFSFYNLLSGTLQSCDTYLFYPTDAAFFCTLPSLPLPSRAFLLLPFSFLLLLPWPTRSHGAGARRVLHFPNGSLPWNAGTVAAFSAASCGLHRSHAIFTLWKGNHTGRSCSRLSIWGRNVGCVERGNFLRSQAKISRASSQLDMTKFNPILRLISPC